MYYFNALCFCLDLDSRMPATSDSAFLGCLLYANSTLLVFLGNLDFGFLHNILMFVVSFMDFNFGSVFFLLFFTRRFTRSYFICVVNFSNICISNLFWSWYSRHFHGGYHHDLRFLLSFCVHLQEFPWNQKLSC